MHIYGPTNVHGPQSLSGPHQRPTARPATPPAQNGEGDKLEISDAARIAARLNEVPEIRQDRVAEIRAAIADGTYETEEKLDLAVERLLDEMG